jgi:hypothetical protein
MKIKFYFLFFSLIANILVSQSNFEESEEFKEFDGWTKLVLLKNNNTGLVEITYKAGINYTLFDAKRKVIKTSKLNLTKLDDNLKVHQIEGVYEIAGDIVVFVVGPEKDGKKTIPHLFRLILDGNTGSLKSEEQLLSLDEMTTGAAYGMIFGDTDIPSFFVEKDPESGHYAVIKYNTIAPETNNRIEVYHYSPEHVLLNKANYNTPTNKYKFTKYLSAYVKGDEYVLLSTCAFNTKKSGGETMRYYISQLNKDKKTFVQKELQYTEYDKAAKSYFTYNAIKENLNLILIVNYTQINQNINPTSLALEKPFPADFKSVNKIYQDEMLKKDVYAGMIEGSFIDNKGNVTYLYHTLSKEYSSSGPGMPAQVISCLFGDVALVTMNSSGKEVSSTVFPLSIFRRGDHTPMIYNSARKGRKVNSGFSPVFDNDWYFGIDFISTENGTYLFFNNLIVNMEMPDDKKSKTIKAISGTTGVKYLYKNGSLIKDYFYEKPVNKKEAKFINPGSSDYNSNTKTYATILTFPKEKTSKVIWTKLD